MQNSSIQNSPNEAEAQSLNLVSSIPECFSCPNHSGFLKPRQPSHTGCPAVLLAELHAMQVGFTGPSTGGSLQECPKHWNDVNREALNFSLAF